MSDNHFFNFGVKITSVATEHTVVIIDAGSRGLDPDLWTKAQINARIMKRFWQHAEKEGARNIEVGRANGEQLIAGGHA